MRCPSADNFLRPSGLSMDDTRDTMVQKVYETIQRVGLLHRGDRVLVGVSGGPHKSPLPLDHHEGNA